MDDRVQLLLGAPSAAIDQSCDDPKAPASSQRGAWIASPFPDLIVSRLAQSAPRMGWVDNDGWMDK